MHLQGKRSNEQWFMIKDVSRKSKNINVEKITVQ